MVRIKQRYLLLQAIPSGYGKQSEIKTTGTIIENVYVEENITVKEKQIPIDNKIYTDSKELAQFLVFGNNPVTKMAKELDTVPIEVIILTADHEIKGTVHVSKYTKTNRELTDLLNDKEKRFLAVTNAEIIAKNTVCNFIFERERLLFPAFLN